MTTTDTPITPRPRLPRIRGRHRRPRPRKALLAAGGLVLAAGALSLVRLVPEPGGGGLHGYGAEAAPRVETGGDGAGDTGTDRDTGTGHGATPGASPSATSVMGGTSAFPRPGGLIPGPSASGSPAPRPSAPAAPGRPSTGSTAVPDRPNTPSASKTPHAPGTGGPTPPAPRPPEAGTPAPRPVPTPAPSRTAPPAPEPEPPGGLCVPLIGLCVDLLDGDG